MNFDEFLVIWLLKKHKMRRLAEVWMLNFLATLKWWKREWTRPLLFCRFAGLTDCAGQEGENTILYSDSHTQQYFLYCFSLLTLEPEYYVGSNDEPQTWIKAEREEQVSKIVLPWLQTQNTYKQFRAGMLKKMLKPNPTGSEETMYDMDKLLEWYIVEYVKKR